MAPTWEHGWSGRAGLWGSTGAPVGQGAVGARGLDLGPGAAHTREKQLRSRMLQLKKLRAATKT